MGKRFYCVRPVAVLCAASAFLSLYGCSHTGGAGGEAEKDRDPVPVKAVVVRSADSFGSDTYIGTVRASRSSVVSSRYAGTLVLLPVREGQYVDKGDVIGTVSSQNVASMLDMSLASLEQARDGYERAKSVYEKGSMAEVKWVEVKTKLAQAEASARAAQQAYDDCTIKAPFSGVVGNVYVDEGVELNMSEPVARIMDISSAEISFSVPESEIGGISVGMRMSLTVPALGDSIYDARVTVKGISASAVSHSYSCTLVPDAPVEGLMPGMVCKVTVKEMDSGIVIPASVVRTGMDGRYVWTVRDGRAEKRSVVIGGFSGDGVTVESGLESGDLLIVEGARKVSSGMAVKVVE